MDIARKSSLLVRIKSKRNMNFTKQDKMNTPKFNHPPTTHEGKIERAVVVFNDPHGFMADKTAFLQSKGLTDTEILEALNIASNGELLRAAGID